MKTLAILLVVTLLLITVTGCSTNTQETIDEPELNETEALIETTQGIIDENDTIDLGEVI